MNLLTDNIQTTNLAGGTPAAKRTRPQVLLVEDNPLTNWSIEQVLSPEYEVVRCAGVAEAESFASGLDVGCVICGSPIAEDPEVLRRLTCHGTRRVIALLSDPRAIGPLPPEVTVLEKPFALNHLTRELSRALTSLAPEHRLPSPSSQSAPFDECHASETFVDRLSRRFKAEVCPVCVHRTADRGCALTGRIDWLECPVFEWASRLGELLKGVRSDLLGDYLDRIQENICPDCRQHPDGKCQARASLDCPLDLYIGLVVPIIEEELKAETELSQNAENQALRGNPGGPG